MAASIDIAPYSADDFIIEATRIDGCPRLRVYRPSVPIVVLGRGSKVDVELHLDACQEDKVPLQRRRGGGCAVVLDPGNLIVSVTLQAEGIGGNQRHFERLSNWVIAALDRLGYAGIRQDGISDLTIGDRKVAGACMYRSKGLLYYSASLLVDADVALMERYLTHPPREPEYRRGRRHGEFVTTLAHEIGAADPADVTNGLRRELRFEELARG